MSTVPRSHRAAAAERHEAGPAAAAPFRSATGTRGTPGGPGARAGRLRRLRPRHLLTTTAAGVEWVLVGAFLGFRLLNVVQALVALPMAVSGRPRGQLDIAALTVLLVEFAVVARVLVSRGRFDDPRLGALDVTVNIAVLASTALFTAGPDRFNTWADWGYPVTLSAALGAGIAFARLRSALLAAALLATTYLATTLPVLSPSRERLSAVNNSLTYLVFAVLVWILAGYLRRLGAAADHARAEAARTAALLERAEHRNLLHDQASLLALLSQEDVDSSLVRALRAQAAAGSAKIRAFLGGVPLSSGPLGAALTGAAAEFSDLPLTVNIALATADLPGRQCAVIADAVRTLLHNVRRHADAEAVVLHAVTTVSGWEVTVTDDGRGFDPRAVVEGYGLAEQVRAGLSRIGGTATVESAPGEGTSVRLTGPLSGASSLS